MLLLGAFRTTPAVARSRHEVAEMVAPDGVEALTAEAASDRARLIALLGPTETLARLQDASPAAEMPAGAQSACTPAIHAAERAIGTKAGLLGAIATVESGRPGRDGRRHPWPWTVNVNGRGRFFASRAQAIAWVRASLRQGATAIDVGCMQVDLEQHPHAFATLTQAFDPALNAGYAARFLRALWLADPRRDWMVAAGFYHSHTPPLAAAYRRLVAAWRAAPQASGAPVKGE